MKRNYIHISRNPTWIFGNIQLVITWNKDQRNIFFISEWIVQATLFYRSTDFSWAKIFSEVIFRHWMFLDGLFGFSWQNPRLETSILINRKNYVFLSKSICWGPSNLTPRLAAWPSCGHTALKSIFWETLFLDQLQDFSFLTFISFDTHFWNQNIWKKIPWHQKMFFRSLIFI